jgi:hypothetical protein
MSASMLGRVASFVSLSAFALAACGERKDPPAPATTAGSSATAAVVTASVASATSSTVDASAVSEADAGVDSTAESDAAVPELYAPDGGALPQTQEMPSLESPTYKVRAAHLWRAIVEDKPELADDAFFPLAAYQQVKGVANPKADWEHRLVAAFHRDVHAYHKRLGPKPEEAKLVEIAVPAAKATWVKPGEEYNKLGYYRVFNSKIRFQRSDGKEGSLLLLSMISWRGEWYVVHVASVK